MWPGTGGDATAADLFCGATANPGMDDTVRLWCSCAGTIAAIETASWNASDYSAGGLRAGRTRPATPTPASPWSVLDASASTPARTFGCPSCTCMCRWCHSPPVLNSARAPVSSASIPTAVNVFVVGDPCVGKPKLLAIVARCSTASVDTAGAGPPAP